MRELVRWRASPKKVRVSVRPVLGGWICTITSNAKSLAVSVWRQTAKWAVLRAAILADRIGIEMDLGCGWAYEHPWLHPGSGERGEKR